MKKQKVSISDLGAIRPKAEKLLEKKPLHNGSQLSEADMLKLVHELEVHQIELEMQNKELQLAKKEAEAASQKYNELYDFAPSGYFTLSRDGKIIALNLSGSQILGEERSRIKNRFFNFYVSGDTRPIFDHFLKNVFNNRTKETCEVTIQAKGNSPISVFLNGALTENGEQCVVNMVDITERRHLTEALRESEETNRTIILETARDGFWLVDIQGRLLEVNETYCRMSGYNRQELLSMSISDLEAVEVAEDTANHMKKVLLQGDDRFETQHRRKDGSIFDLEISVQYQPTNGGRLVAFLHDITKRKQAEEELRKSEQRLKFHFENSPLAVVEWDAGFAVTEWSMEAERIFGWSREEVIGKSIESLKLIYEDDIPIVNYTMEILLSGKEHTVVNSNRNITKSGAVIDCTWYNSVLCDQYGEMTSVMSLVEDITERKVKEEAVRKLNKTLFALSKSSQAMSQSVDEADYMEQVCKIVVNDTDFAMVWIGFAEDDKAKSIRPVASAGFSDDYLETIKISWADSDIGRGPTGTAIRTGKMTMCNNMLTDPVFEPWREQALKRGYASSIVFPLKTGDKTFGAITIYSKYPESFLDDEINLLSELAYDLALGITAIRLRASHQLAEKALSKSHNELEVLVKERTHELRITNDLLIKEINIRKQHEQSLKLTEEKYRTVADFTYGWEYWLDQKDKMLYCSPSCERITGYKASAFIENPRLLHDIVHPDDLKIFQCHKEGESKALEIKNEMQYRIIRFDGTIVWIGHACQPIFDKTGNFIGNRGSNRDITNRKEMEQLLKTSNQKYKLLSENITDGIFICRNGYFEYVNKALSRIFGYDDRQLEGVKLVQLVMPDYRDELKNFLTLNAPKNQVLNVEIECLKKDFSTVFVEILLNYLASEQAIYGVAHDITEKKQIQKNIIKAIIQTEENEKANFSKELHDGLGPLLSTIKLYLQWSERSKTNKSRKEIILKAEDILEEALSTVKEISNKLSPHLLTYYGLTSAIQSFVGKLEESSAIKISFESNVTRRLDMEIEAAIYRATIECINNTLKYANAKNITITLTDNDHQLHLQYKDDGIGFDFEEVLSTKKGLGLFNLRNRIQTIGGKINLYSKPGHGIDYHIAVNI